MAFLLPFGQDRALGYPLPFSPYGTGGSGIIGTAPPAGSIMFSDVNGGIVSLQEDTDSPTIERGVQCTAQHKCTATYNDAINVLGQCGMGTIVIDSFGLVWRVLTCTVQADGAAKGNAAKIITVSECLSFDTPPDDFQVNSVDLGIDIIKHPRYFPNLYPTDAELSTIVGQVKETIIRAIQTYRDSPFFPTASALNGLLNGFVQNIQSSCLGNGEFLMTVPNPNYNSKFNYTQDTTIQDGTVAIVPPPPATANGQVNDPTIPVAVTGTFLATNPSVKLALAAAQEIITKLWRMEDSPYLAGVELKWSQYYFLPPLFNLGSYLQTPIDIVPNYFLQPDRPLGEIPPRGGVSFPVAGLDNIFAYNSTTNPQDYSSDGFTGSLVQISWLRKADEIQYERTWFKITRTWVGSAIGYFDTQIYGASERPTTPSDYKTFS